MTKAFDIGNTIFEGLHKPYTYIKPSFEEEEWDDKLKIQNLSLLLSTLSIIFKFYFGWFYEGMGFPTEIYVNFLTNFK